MPPKKRIAVIGGGAAGLAVLKVFLEQPQLKDHTWSIIAFEARHDIGGVWLPAPPTGEPPLTPLYNSLTTNLPHPIMAFQTLLFPSSTPLFPRASAVLSYLRSYASTFDLNPHIRLQTTVEHVNWTGKQWQLTLVPGGAQMFDYVVVANGHYFQPKFPDEIPGAQAWRAAGKVMHSAWYREPEPFRNKICLVIGGGPSGLDISAEIAKVAPKVYHSVTGAANEDSGNICKRGRPISFEPNGAVTFEDGTQEADVQLVIAATGYQYYFPFFPPSILQTQPEEPHRLYNSGAHVYPLAKHVFPLQDDFPPSTVAFIGVPSKIIPFPIFEAQARAVAKVFSDSSALDIVQETADIAARDKRLRETEPESRIARLWHRMQGHEQFDYRNGLLSFASPSAREKYGVEDWAVDMYVRAADLRKAWRQLEAEGVSEEWVRGVGEGGIEEWIELMRRILETRSEGATEVKI